MRCMFKHGRRRARLRGGCSSYRERGRGGGGILDISSVHALSQEEGDVDTYRTTKGSRMLFQDLYKTR